MNPVRILVVEDEGIIARDIHRELLSLGYEPVGPASTGSQAIELARQHRPQLALMDIHLAGPMDGVEAATVIREELGIASLFLTAYATPEVVARAKNATPLGYLVKPFESQALRSTIEVALHQDGLQRQLRASEQRYRALIDTAHDAIVTTDAKGMIVTWSRAAEGLFGWSAAEAVGQSVNIVVPESMRAERALVYARLLGDDETVRAAKPLERIALRRDGREVPVDISFAHWTQDGEVFVSNFIRDTSQRADLERQLRHAQKMEVVGRLAGGIAHDFNNVLTVVNGTCDLELESLAPDDARREAFTDIRDAGERAALLTRQLLTFSRRRNMDRRVVSVGAVVTQAANFLRRLIGADVQLVLEVGADARDTASVDVGQFEQVILNLAVNAREAMPDGGTLTIRTERSDSWVLVRVSDTGVGMTEDVRSHLFEPYFTTKERGTGLGLATVYGVVTQFDGRITVESTLGVGTTFEIALPIAAPVETESAGPVAKSSRGAGRVLVVDDEPALRKITERMLIEAGYQVVVATSGAHALSLLRDRVRVDLVLSDVVMPDMSGPQLVEHLASLPQPPLVLFMSGYRGERIDHLRIQPQQLLHKPFTPAMLADRIQVVLDARPVTS